RFACLFAMALRSFLSLMGWLQVESFHLLTRQFLIRKQEWSCRLLCYTEVTIVISFLHNHNLIMKPLEGITVLDLTRLLPGAVATMMLGDFGADVIKIEEPGSGDPARQSRAGIKQPGAYFLATNRNKRSITINLKQERGREIFLKLAGKADVVVEGF